MVEVKEITKHYGEQKAVDGVSFSVGTGEIVGFIGPNGAGKSTTMKIITGTLLPDQGEVLIKGMPVSKNLKEVRRIIGYLPEHNPLYLEMYIREYLAHVAKLYRGGDKKKAELSIKEQVEQVIGTTGLGQEAHKRIGALSKGYRQRVGLAQALIHDPEILILDEPTTGLDPNQLVEIRQLIHAIGKQKTVLLSTHLMQEVEAICDRVLIINKGRIAADDSSEGLKARSHEEVQTIEVELGSATDPAIWKQLPFVQEVKNLEECHFLLETTGKEDFRGEIFNFAVSQGLTILSMNHRQRSLEEVFKEITGR